MKIRPSTAIIITLVIMTLALTAGCATTGPSTNSNGAGVNANAANTRPATTTATPAASTTTTTTAAGSLSTPTNTFMAFYEASKKNDVPGVVRTLSKTSQDFLTAEAKKQDKTLDQALTESLKTADVPTTTPETRNEKIDGDKATLEVKDDKGNKWDTFNFVKEGAEWKLMLGIE